MATVKFSVTNILQNIFFCVQEERNLLKYIFKWENIYSLATVSFPNNLVIWCYLIVSEVIVKFRYWVR